ncbi:MAG: ROK family protein [Clostridia bacterium]|nr:ROK family protein [Clostridia bacterium]
MRIGIDLGGTTIKAGLVTEDGKIRYKSAIPTGAQRHYTEILADMAKLAIKVCEDTGYSIDDITSIGIGSPGSCDAKNGVLVYANNINFHNVPVREEMQKYINKPIYLENDANVAAYAEYCMGDKNEECFIAVTLGTGVGGGIIMNGKIFSGYNGAGGELGHMVIKKDGAACTCGRKGCWEAYASASALIAQTKRAIIENKNSIMNDMIDGNIDRVDGKTAFDAAKQGDKAALEVVKKYAEYVGCGIANIINIFQPEKVVIGGGISNQGDYLLNPIKEYCTLEVYSGANIGGINIEIAKLGNDAGIIGAALLNE